jgi:uncharacterized SAM-binding protein YcdF (DUF218 family)
MNRLDSPAELPERPTCNVRIPAGLRVAGRRPLESDEWRISRTVFVLKKIVAPFLLPPGVFIILLVGSGFWLMRRKNYRLALMQMGLGLLLWGLSITPVADRFLMGLESEFPIPEAIAGDVIILLGGGVADDVPDLTGTGFPLGDMQGRIITAVRLQKTLQVPVIISSGQVYEGRPAAAPIYKRILTDLGVDDRQIILESQSRDTYENAKYSQAICARRGFVAPVLVTSAYHLKRARLAFDKAGVQVTPVPAYCQTQARRTYGWYDYLPQAENLANVSAALHEYLGIVFYRFAY